ncbi:MAG: hypothetical protein ABSB74_17485 [Tepidisphaeraceae bacterium]
MLAKFAYREQNQNSPPQLHQLNQRRWRGHSAANAELDEFGHIEPTAACVRCEPHPTLMASDSAAVIDPVPRRCNLFMSRQHADRSSKKKDAVYVPLTLLSSLSSRRT